mmetsp:Transcript_6151/g.23224  ORF Transcript_6151/g.23224 Transcript_6151/m.23224 type:complete len:95 (-) Transcript_6151:175-459(-)
MHKRASGSFDQPKQTNRPHISIFTFCFTTHMFIFLSNYFLSDFAIAQTNSNDEAIDLKVEAACGMGKIEDAEEENCSCDMQDEDRGPVDDRPQY